MGGVRAEPMSTESDHNRSSCSPTLTGLSAGPAAARVPRWRTQPHSPAPHKRTPPRTAHDPYGAIPGPRARPPRHHRGPRRARRGGRAPGRRQRATRSAPQGEPGRAHLATRNSRSRMIHSRCRIVGSQNIRYRSTAARAIQQCTHGAPEQCKQQYSAMNAHQCAL